MTEGRPEIPAWMRREVLVEAGHRCAIPTCRQVPVVLAHIEPWAKVKKHEVHNLIALCHNCHFRFDHGDIDRLAMKQYKANLSVVMRRYGDLERRVLELFASQPEASLIEMTGGQDLHLWYLLRDGLLHKVPDPPLDVVIIMDGLPAKEVYALTEAGRDFINRWVAAVPLD